jgi:hypothetical protein
MHMLQQEAFALSPASLVSYVCYLIACTVGLLMLNKSECVKDKLMRAHVPCVCAAEQFVAGFEVISCSTRHAKTSAQSLYIYIYSNVCNLLTCSVSKGTNLLRIYRM